MINGIGFEFPRDASDQWDGFNDAGMEHFAGSPYLALGREIPQNVVDATDLPPARIVVRLIQVDTQSIPNFAEFRAALLRCQEIASDESDKARIFFDQAMELIAQRKIPVLQISDFNTTGVRGPCKNGTPYYAFLKQSKKSGETQLGTFGIGKYAPFVVSRLRTVFISTVWSDGARWHHYVQGKSILMSHYDVQGSTRKGVGYWGIRDRCLPVVGLEPSLPGWLLRAPRNEDLPAVAGTTVSILGFDAVTGWQRMLTAAIAENFFGAIVRGRLEVDIDEKFALNRHTVHGIFLQKEIRDSISEMKGEPDKFDSSGLFLEAITDSPEVIVEHTENLHLEIVNSESSLARIYPRKWPCCATACLLRKTWKGSEGFPSLKNSSLSSSVKARRAMSSSGTWSHRSTMISSQTGCLQRKTNRKVAWHCARSPCGSARCSSAMRRTLYLRSPVSTS